MDVCAEALHSRDQGVSDQALVGDKTGTVRQRKSLVLSEQRRSATRRHRHGQAELHVSPKDIRVPEEK